MGGSSIAVFLKRTSGFDLVNKHRILGEAVLGCRYIQPHPPGLGNVLLWPSDPVEFLYKEALHGSPNSQSTPAQ